MGCDAHAFLEYQEAPLPTQSAPSAYWSTLAVDVNISRDYLLFATLAQVRGEGLLGPGRERLQEALGHAPAPKGLPEPWLTTLATPPEEDLYDLREIHLRRSACDAHSHTYLSYHELEQAALRYFILSLDVPPADSLHNADLDAILGFCRPYVRRGCTVRMVLWFDS